LAVGKERLSITGWFHGPLTEARKLWPLVRDPGIAQNFESLVEEAGGDELSEWICADYLSSSAMDAIANVFAETSYVDLKKFLRSDMYDALLVAFGVASFDDLVGPPNARRYRRLDTVDTSGVISRFQTFCKSTNFVSYVTSLTGLDRPIGVFSECRRFRSGDYTLMHDNVQEEPGLDLIFSVTSSPEWQDHSGGSLMYLDGQDTLLTVDPEQNKLTLVYRDDGVLRYVKYVNHQAGANERHELSMTFRLE
jgi:hypothetical protein